MTNKTTEPAALAGIEPVAWLNKKLPHMAILTKPDEGGGWFPVYSAATVERLVQERDELKKDELAKFAKVCVAEERLIEAQAREHQLRAALEYKSKREEALKARDLKCACDHNEYCSKCFPLDFREGGMFYETPDSVMRNALAKYPRKADELEGKK